MMSALWWIPVGVGAAGLIPLYQLTRRVAAELAQLRASVSVLSDLRPAVVAVESDAAGVRRALENLGLR
jgi:hypothetical protein